MTANPLDPSDPSSQEPLEDSVRHQVADALGIEDENTMHPLLQKLIDNIRVVLGGICAILILVGAYGIFDSMSKSDLEESRAELAGIILSKQGEEKIAALKTYIGDAPDELEINARLELISTLLERGQYKEAAEQWDEVADAADGSFEVAAKIGKAKALALSGDSRQALKIYKDLSGDAGEAYANHLSNLKANAAVRVGDKELAVKEYEKLLNAPVGTESGKKFIAHRINVLKGENQ